jgi:hypothetical protein
MLKFNILNFNYNFFLDINEIGLEADLNLSENLLISNNLNINLINKFSKGNLIYILLLFELFNLQNIYNNIYNIQSEFVVFNLID